MYFELEGALCTNRKAIESSFRLMYIMIIESLYCTHDVYECHENCCNFKIVYSEYMLI